MRTSAFRRAPEHPPFHTNLEALRGIAALLVVLHHLSLNSGSILASLPFLGQGWLFVDLFFVLSGYVIASVHADAEPTISAARRFLIRRFFRLYPLHFVTLAVALIVDIRTGTAQLPGYVVMVAMNLGLIHAWGIVPGSVLNGPSWSISAEWGAYVIFTAICLATPLRPRRIQLLSVIGVLSLLSLIGWRDATLDGDLLLRLPRCVMSFALGAGVWAWCHDRSPLRSKWASAVQISLAVCMFVLLATTERYPHLTMLMPILSAAMVGAMVLDPGSAVSGLLDRSLPQWLGRCSYSLYLVHMPLFKCLLLVTPGGWPSQSLFANLWIAVALCLLLPVTALTHALIERPFRALGRRISDRIPGVATDPQPELA